MKARYLKLLDYNTWANRRQIACLLENNVINNRTFLLFSHLLTAEEVWLCRIKEMSAPVQRLWELYPSDTLQQMVEDNNSTWQAYLADCSDRDLARDVTYQNTKGESFTTRLDDIITHLVNHGTHHRAQICSLLQQEKVQPPVVDYIVYLREQNSTAG